MVELRLLVLAALAVTRSTATAGPVVMVASGQLAATPVTAAVLAFGANFLMWILNLLENAVQAEWLSEAMRFLSLYRRNEPFMMGQLSVAGILFDLSFIAAFLALTVWHLDRKRYGK